MFFSIYREDDMGRECDNWKILSIFASQLSDDVCSVAP